MNNKAIGAVILVVGIVLLVLGFNEFGTFGSRAGRAFGGGLSSKLLFYFIAGGVCTAMGLMQMLKK